MMSLPLHVLILEDLAGDAELIAYELQRAGFDPLWRRVETEQEYQACLHEDLDLIVADYTLPQFNALRALQILKARDLDIPFIVITGTVSEEVVAEVMREGAADYLLKDRPARLGQAVLHALEQKQLRVEKRKAEEALRRYNADLEQTIRMRTAALEEALAKERELNELKARFVSMISHEFRTPLAVMQTASDLLTRYSDQLSPERRQSQFEEIQSQIKHLTTLLDEILTISRSQTVGLHLQLSEIELESFINSIVLENRSLLSDHVLEIAVTGQSRPISVDSNLMRQVVVNLLTNAAKFSPGETHIALDLTFEPEQVRLRVRDHGIGIPRDDLDHMFDLFHRGRNASAIPGTGLGLAIVKQVVEAHGGAVSVESREGVGTSVTVTLPANPATTTLAGP